ncbi:MAG: sel1 repeat family protein, partial [Terriglobales bacterium]
MDMTVRNWLASALLLAALCTATPAGAQQPTRRPANDSGVTALRKAAAQADAKAEFSLGLHYYRGQGVPRDYAKAAYWYAKAAAQSDADAEYFLGALYDSGQGVPQDSARAAYWYARAAARGVAGAEYNLGVDYENGQGVPQD